MATILVVDDEKMVSDLLRTVLIRHGHEVLTASGGREALELFRKHSPTIMLLDLGLPDMNGIEVLKQIRAINPQAVVMVLTGGGTDDLENQARELGVTDYLRKGLSLDVLVGALARAVQQPVPAPSPPSHAQKNPAEATEADSILVVDDEAMVRGLLSEYLSLRGYRVRTAQNGPEALASVGQYRPRLVILDLYMPGMNGVEVLRELRNKGRYDGAVIVLSASQDEKLLQETLALGSVDIMSKPVDLERLLLAIQVGLVLSAS
jgi:DNA-binding response OmpR family regulator